MIYLFSSNKKTLIYLFKDVCRKLFVKRFVHHKVNNIFQKIIIWYLNLNKELCNVSYITNAFYCLLHICCYYELCNSSQLLLYILIYYLLFIIKGNFVFKVLMYWLKGCIPFALLYYIVTLGFNLISITFLIIYRNWLSIVLLIYINLHLLLNFV